MLNELAKLKQIISIQLNIDRSCIDKKSREKEYVRARIIYSNILMKELQIPIAKMSQYLKKIGQAFTIIRSNTTQLMIYQDIIKTILMTMKELKKCFLENKM